MPLKRIEKYARVRNGYSPVKSVKKIPVTYRDLMELFLSAKTSLTPMILSKMSELCGTRDADTFERKYALFLLQLRENGEDAIVQYFERNCVRVDSLVDLLINIVSAMEEGKRIKMARGLREGCHRLSGQHRRHNNGIRLFCDDGITSEIESVGKWLIHDRERTYRIEEKENSCTCDKILNNHCYKCGACGYSFRCSCLDDSTVGVSCIHAHIALTYSGQGRREYEGLESNDRMAETATIPALGILEPEVETLTAAEVETLMSPPQASSEAEVEGVSMSMTEIADTCKKLTHTINAVRCILFG
ncbi:unnamed protein product [Cylicocyclus nassatus]|uniref:Uncharacterized protein n=1 Tax=Cylicocyclus nassatus TaxID=53992 RepID=A0AA36DQJ3_CYLNA|nr:unnamed protein product [Cylicocyclus nassatus]